MTLREVVSSLPITTSVVGQGETLVADANGRLRNQALDRWDVRWSGATAYAAGTAYAEMADSSAAILAAITTAKSLGVPVVGRGTYRVDATITLDTNADLSGATFVCSDTAISPLVRIGTAVASASAPVLTIAAPSVLQAAKTGLGWTGASVGVELCNLNSSDVVLGKITGFTTGVLVTSSGTIGTSYNTIRMRWMNNNKINLHLTPGSVNGWTNENVFIGGRFSHESAEGTPTAGTRHILLTALAGTQPNNNVWVKASLESPGVAEYQVESIGGYHNRFLQCRWEFTGGSPKVYWNQLDATYRSRFNVIDGGYGSEGIAFTVSANSAGNPLLTPQQYRIAAGASGQAAMRISNVNSSSGGSLQVLDSATDPLTAVNTDWLVQLSASDIKVKAKAAAVERWSVASSNGLQSWGDGVNPVDVAMNRGAADRLTMGAGDYFRTGAVASLPSASSAYRGYTIRVEGGAGVADVLYICEKNAADAYEWRAV